MLCYMVKTAHDKLESNLKACKEPFEARNNTQAYCAKALSIIFIEVRLSHYNANICIWTNIFLLRPEFKI